jgi:DNA modification methylase
MRHFEINTIIQGHTLEVLKTFPDESVNCVICSPPYWSLRDYQTVPLIWDSIYGCEHEWGKELPGRRQRSENDIKDMNSKEATKTASAFNDTGGNFCLKCSAWRGSLGLEPTPELYIKHLLEIFDEIKRVLRKDGTCWVNLWDTYNAGRSGGWAGGKYGISKPENAPNQSGVNVKNIPVKSLVGIPEMFVLGMRERGWIRRNTIIWYKRNTMPSSAKDRFTNDFEYVFFFVKSNDTQYWTNERTFELVIKQPLGIHGIEGIDWEWRECPRCKGSGCRENKRCTNGKIKYSFWEGHDYWFSQQFEEIADTEYTRERYKYNPSGGKKAKLNKDVNWKGNELAKYFPQQRNKRCVWDIPTSPFSKAHFATFPPDLIEPMIRSGCPEGGITLDPFMGAGTTALVAIKNRRNFIGIELNPEYVEMANKRIKEVQVYL